MPDPNLPVEQDIGALVLQAPESVWQKIRKALRVETREQAASLVQTDDRARQLLISLLSSGNDTVLTKKPTVKEESSFVSAASKTRTPLSQQMYGTQKAKVQF